MDYFLRYDRGRRVWKVNIEYDAQRIYLRFPYNAEIKDEVKAMSGARWSPDGKYWHVDNNPRNRFAISYLARAPKGREGDSGYTPNPYLPYRADHVSFTPTRPLFDHQIRMVRHGLTVKRGEWAAEMGTGKTLAAIELMESLGYDSKDYFFIAPSSALVAVKYEMQKWESKIRPQFFTYEGLRKVIAEWPKNQRAPRCVIFDESSRLKTPTAQRTQAAFELTRGMIEDHLKDKGIDPDDFDEYVRAWPELEDGPYIILMSGTPAPKNPTDWWSQSEIACPGYLKERDIFAMKQRLSVMQEYDSPMTGGKYKKVIAWKDGGNICEICGRGPDDSIHEAIAMDPDHHEFRRVENEVDRLYKRLSGLVLVIRKDECMDLPEKVYHTIRLSPAQDVLRAVQLLDARAKSTIDLLTHLRALSDGFQYEEKVVRYSDCTVCYGNPYREAITLEDGTEQLISDVCPACEGTGRRPVTERQTIQIPCPKEGALKDLLDQHEEYSRIVVYAGFTGSVDRCVSICQKEGWTTLRVDGRGVQLQEPDGRIFTTENYQEFFLDTDTYPQKVAFVGQPGAGGMGLTLTSSPSIVFWSNDFNGESRMQAEDRIHRPGSRGANIYDLIHLPQDEIVIRNLKEKKRLQDMTLGRVKEMLKQGYEYA